jgi:hypothetical protein
VEISGLPLWGASEIAAVVDFIVVVVIDQLGAAATIAFFAGE